jgi:hypothetical protein
MIKKKAKGKTAATKETKKKTTSRKTKTPANPAEVRKDIAKMVKSGARKITKAVMEQAMTGQLAPAKFLFEVAAIYPASTDGSQATTDEDCLAKTLLDRLDIPDRPVGRDEEDEPVRTPSPATGAEKCSDKLQGQQEGAESEADEESKHVSALV